MEIVNTILSMLTLVFSIASIIAGLFTAYFGSGKSRAVGGILIIIGLIVFIIFLWGGGFLEGIFGSMPDESSILYFKDHILIGISAVIGAIIGAIIALGIFLLAIMKA
jgi:hypothetical protein